MGDISCILKVFSLFSLFECLRMVPLGEKKKLEAFHVEVNEDIC